MSVYIWSYITKRWNACVNIRHFEQTCSKSVNSYIWIIYNESTLYIWFLRKLTAHVQTLHTKSWEVAQFRYIWSYINVQKTTNLLYMIIYNCLQLFYTWLDRFLYVRTKNAHKYIRPYIFMTRTHEYQVSLHTELGEPAHGSIVVFNGADFSTHSTFTRDVCWDFDLLQWGLRLSRMQ